MSCGCIGGQWYLLMICNMQCCWLRAGAALAFCNSNTGARPFTVWGAQSGLNKSGLKIMRSLGSAEDCQRVLWTKWAGAQTMLTVVFLVEVVFLAVAAQIV